MGIEEVLAGKRGDVLRAAARHGASDVRVFGSVARGDAGPTSDVDLLVTMERGRSLFDFGRLWDDLEQLLGRKVDLATENGLDPLIRDRVLAEAVPL